MLTSNKVNICVNQFKHVLYIMYIIWPKAFGHLTYITPTVYVNLPQNGATHLEANN